MIIQARELSKYNTGQIVTFNPLESEESDSRVMSVVGILDAIEITEDGRRLIVGGTAYDVEDSDGIEIFRSAEMRNIRALWTALEEITEALTVLTGDEFEEDTNDGD